MEVTSLINEYLGPFKYLIGFIVLPFFYVRSSAQAHNRVSEYLDHAKNHTKESNNNLNALELDALEETLLNFDLQIWILFSLVTIALIIFSLSEVLEMSRYFSCNMDVKNLEDIQLNILKETCNQSLNWINIFGLCIGLLAIYYVYLAKLLIEKKITDINFKLMRNNL